MWWLVAIIGLTVAVPAAVSATVYLKDRRYRVSDHEWFDK